MSLKDHLKKRLLLDMVKKSRETHGKEEYVVLVIDPHTSRIISSCARMYDVMETGVLVLENIDFKRERLSFAAIYFIENSESSITKLLADFENPKKPQYSTVHLFFTSRVGPDHMKRIAACKELVKRIKTFQEINVDFIARESRVFDLVRTKTVIPQLYFPPDQKVLSNELTYTSSQLVSLLLTLNEEPYIRYSANGHSCKTFAAYVQRDLQATKAKLKTWKPSANRPRGVLLILDRSIDPIAPLMHEYTYQAMVNDLLSVKGELCTLNPKADFSKLPETERKEKEAENVLVLSETDELWCNYRHWHIGKVMFDVSKRFSEFKASNNMAKLQDNKKGATVKDMIQAMKQMPQYKAQMRMYAKHMSLAQSCMDKFTTKKLEKLGECEQDMTSGITEDGEKVLKKNITALLVHLCRDEKVNVLDKLRLLMIYIISQGNLIDSTRKELMKEIDPALQEAVRNLEKLGVDMATKQKLKRSKHDKKRLQEFAKRQEAIPMALMRYIPYIDSVLRNFASLDLNETDYPYISPPPSDYAKSLGKKPSRTRNWRGKEKKGSEEKEDTRPYFIVYVLGGITYSELRSIYEIAGNAKVNLICGSTDLLTPTEYIRGLAGLSKASFNRALRASGALPDEILDDDEEEEGKQDDDSLSDVEVDIE